MPEERRIVTVLFADVAGSTALGESSDPEELRAVLGRYYAIARDVIGEHGGTVEKFIGDAVMAVFGMPQAHGDDAERALASALALREALAGDGTTAALRIRMGVNTGDVVAAREAERGDFLVTGDAVNVAARLQQHAEPGAILVGSRTRTAAAGFRFGTERALQLKGKDLPVRAAPLEGRAVRARQTAPFVGREADLAQLDLAAARAYKERRPQVVTITAPAGTGKSRLVEEFLSSLRAREPALIGAVTQCLPYGSAVTFLPLRGLIRGLVAQNDDESALASVRTMLTSADYGPADADILCERIAATLGLRAEPPTGEREEFHGAWRVLVEIVAARGPVAIVFEDLHWASDSLLDLVESITQPRVAAPLLMVVLARPELFDRRPAWGGGRRNFTALGLEPLSADETRRLIGLLTEGAPPQLAESIVERAEGNPFFAGELVRAYEERRGAGASDAEIVLPDTVHATVLARLDALAEGERSALQYAAVAGRTVRRSTVEAALGRTDGVEQALAALAERELLIPRPAGAFVFRHIVIREVAYSTLPRAERARAHIRVARHLSERGAATGEEPIELLAYHYRQALAMSPGGRPPEDLDPKTIVAVLERAAAVAWAGGAFHEAAGNLEEALRLAPAEDHLRLHEAVGDIFQFGDRGAEGYLRAYERWGALEPARRETAHGARLLRKLLTLYARWTGSLRRPPDDERFGALLAEARALLAPKPDATEEARLTLAEGLWSRNVEDTYRRSLLPRLRTAADTLAAGGDPNETSLALDALGSLLRDLGEGDEAIACARRRLAFGDRLSTLERNDASSVLAWDLVTSGRYREAIATVEQARAARRPGESEAGLMHATAWGILAARLVGEWDAALHYCDVLRAIWEDIAGSGVSARFTLRGWYAGIWVARARGDTTRLAAYRSAATAVADVDALPPEDANRSAIRVMLSGDHAAARTALAAPGATPTDETRAAILAELVFEHDLRVPEELLATVERVVPPTALLSAVVQLARALEGGSGALRGAVAMLDRSDLGPDAARAAALLARHTELPGDIDDARRRLGRYGDSDYLTRLADWS